MALGDNIVTILNTVKDLTQPDMLQTLNNALGVYRQMDIDVPEQVSLISIMKELRTPEMRRSMIFLIKFLQNLAARQSAAPALTPAADAPTN